MSLLRSLAMLLMAATLAACGGKLGEIYPEAVSARLFARSYARDHDEISEVRALTPDQIKRLRRDIHADSAALITAACFVPHHFFRMYDEKGKMIGEIAVCFCCSGVRANPKLSTPVGMEVAADYQDLAALVRELGSTPRIDCESDEAVGL